ncbi:MAG: hypothetical protein H0W47_06820 [Polaromonas sp.]|uniref:hypothetical protein n=1 Tax=Polaromonas sp. TaxID=1869339 RepID=UPI00178D88C2|nr:hypothetical protein [Polaromonas sp.]MBA3593497.1 hypothetical protein [Polaromonas sp.]
MTTARPSAVERLAASRQAIVRDMNGEDPVSDNADGEESKDVIRESGVNASSGSWGLVKQVAASWWRSHPAQLALDVATPMMQGIAERHPVKMLGIAAATGSALVLLRPWRLISVTGVALALLKSTELSGVVQSMLRGGPPDRPR